MHHETRQLGEEIANMAARIDAATHELLHMVGRFEQQQGFTLDGALTCAHWLGWRTGMDLGTAREYVREMCRPRRMISSRSLHA